MEAQHTATPFRVDSEGCIVSCATGAQIAHIIKPGSAEGKANGEFFVRACNAHADLLDACKAVDADFEAKGAVSVEVIELVRAALA